MSDFMQNCPEVYIGGKSYCHGPNCDCSKEIGTGCMYGICVCLSEGHLSFDGISCLHQNYSNILLNQSDNELGCPRVCLANKFNSCYGAALGTDGRCYCPDGTLVKPVFTKDHRINITATKKFCLNHSKKEIATSEYWNSCPSIFNGGEDKCENKKCDCASEPETGCIFGLCVCTLEGHLSFDGISCADHNHPNVLRNKTLHDLSCPRTCLANKYNSCLYGSKSGKDGKCYCPDGTLVKPMFTKDHRIDALATEEFCRDHQEKKDMKISKYWNHCPGIFDGGKDKCEDKQCDCAREQKTACMFGICVCKSGYMNFDGINCADPNHPSILKKAKHSNLICPRSCLANEYNSCPGAKRGADGRCYCLDGTLVRPVFTNDHRINLNETKGFCLKHSSTLHSLSNDDSILLPIGILTTACIMTLIMSLFFWKFRKTWRIRNMKNKVKSNSDGSEDDSLLPLSNLVDNPIYFAEINKLLEKHSIPCQNIRKERRIGKGNFGEVFKGIYLAHNEEKKNIAIKIPKCQCGTTRDRKTLISFYEEALITIKFQHTNVLSCFGISGSFNEPWLIVEYARYGDLKAVLLANSGVFTPTADTPVLRNIDLMIIIKQVASGMAYLEKQHFIHRDLAARNCLVGDNLVIKVSDFGLTKDVYLNEYFTDNRAEDPLPIRWMAPESITHRRFTSQSDVWSYGILLWEVFTFGRSPYYLLSNSEVLERISLGIHPEPPEGCPDIVSSLMLLCWEYIPDDRGSFEDILQRLSQTPYPLHTLNEGVNLETVYAEILADT